MAEINEGELKNLDREIRKFKRIASKLAIWPLTNGADGTVAVHFTVFDAGRPAQKPK